MNIKKLTKNREMVGFWFIVPALVYMIALIGYPLLYNIVLGFKNLDIKTFKGNTAKFIGFDNYMALFSDNVFVDSIIHTLQYTVFCLIIQFTIGFAFAMFFRKKFPLSGFIRGLLLVAYMMPMSVTALLGRNMFGVTEGVINQILLNIGLIAQPIDWLVSSNTAMIAVIITNCWVGIPFNMLLLTTGLSNIPEDIYESASIDGANIVQKFFFMTLPLLRSAMLAVIMLGLIYTFKVFDLIYIMTSGGPNHSTEVLSTYSYNLSFVQYKFSAGSAAAVVLFLFLLCVGFFYLRLTMKEEVN
ncbi:MAG: carbohydrate ABC transporter permease [Lachnospirales bacterium]